MEPVCRQAIFVKIDRVAAWILLVSMFGFFVSGFVMAKGISGEEAVALHNTILPFVGGVSFLVHTFFAIRLAFMRWKIKNRFSMVLQTGFYIALFLALFYGMFFLSAPSYSQNTPTQKETAGQGTQSTNQSSSSQKVFTASELAAYDGKNGNPSYVAVDGVVYDLTTVFKNGIHFGHVAGRDLTDAFYVKHVRSQITKYPVVGTLE